MADPIRLDAILMHQVVEIFAELYRENEQMKQHVTFMQTVSTAQVERIRALEGELKRMKGKA